MKRNWTKALTFLMLAFVLVVTACGSKGGSEGGGQAAEGGNNGGAGGAKTLGIMWWGADDRHEATVAALDLYSQQNPGVTFKPEYMSWDAYWQKLPTLAASKAVPDVLQMDAAYINEYASRGVLADLSDIDLTGIVDEKVIENLKIDGKLYGIPLSMNAQGIAYNREDLEAAGVALPQKGWTWDDYFAFAREAAEKLPEGKYGVTYNNTYDFYQFYQTAQGKGPLMSDGGKTFNLDKESFTTFYNTLEDLKKNDQLPPPEVNAAFVENDPQADPLASGKSATKSVTTGSVAVMETMLPGKVEVVNIPYGPAGGGWAQSTIFLSVSKDAGNLEEAKKFVKWFITDKEAGRVLGMTRGIPINEEIFAELEPNLERKDTIGKELYDVALDKALPFYPVQAGFTEWVDAFKTEVDAVMFGQQTVEQAYEKLNQLGQDIAARNQ